jgi:hypothetical protein
MDPSQHPKSTWHTYPLINEVRTGCTTRLGADTMSIQVDKELEKTFLFIDNIAALPSAKQPVGYSKIMNVDLNTNEALLFVRHKVPMTCSEAC